jgi:hypothetical protein
MGRSSRKSLSQKVVGVATTGMPSPVRKVLGTRIVALLIILSIPLLIATGILTVQWKDGRPKVSLDRERAAEVRQEVTKKVEAYREQRQGEDRAVSDFVSNLRGQETVRPDFSANWQQPEGGGERVTEQFDDFKEGVVQQSEQAWSNVSTAVRQEENEAKQAFRPFSQLKDRFGGEQR